MLVCICCSVASLLLHTLHAVALLRRSIHPPLVTGSVLDYSRGSAATFPPADARPALRAWKTYALF
jgi:hypothetical protein